MLHSLLVFDEVDAGIGGQTAVAVGEKIKRLAENEPGGSSDAPASDRPTGGASLCRRESQKSSGRLIITVTKLDYIGTTKELGRMMALPENVATNGNSS